MDQSKILAAIFNVFICCLLVQQVRSKWPNECLDSGIIQDENCYLIQTLQMSYTQAVTSCQLHGGALAKGTLAMMKNSIIQALIVAAYRKAGLSVQFWAGVSDRISEGTFRYQDRVALQGFKPWASNQPDNGNSRGYHYGAKEDCVSVNSEELWLDENCEAKKYFACEFKRDNEACKMQDVNIPNAEYQHCYTQDKLPYNESISIKCHEGYVLVGPNNITCLADSTWSTVPQCIQGCQPPKQLPHSTFLNLKETYPLGSQVTYICDDGYVTSKQERSHSQITCGPNSRWQPENSGCSLEEKYTIGTMDVDPNTSVSLPCVICDGNNSIEECDNHAKYLWLKNSEYINKTRLDYSIDTNGTLIINNMSVETVGQYICFRDDDDLTPGLMGFELTLKLENCAPSNKTPEEVTFQEGSSAIITCPHASSHHDFTWFKDGQRYYPRSDQTLFPDGSMHTKSLQYSDEGVYTCRMLKKGTLCENNHSIEITVLASAHNICGKIEPGYPHPWAVSLWQKDEIAPFCYGTLIHKNWVVTTAQCLAGFNRKRTLNVFARFGYNGFLNEDLKNEFSVKSVKIHPKFSKKLYVNDIGLVQLRHPIRFTRSIRPICLPLIDLTVKQPCDRSPALNGSVVGWGPLEKDDYDQSFMINETMYVITERQNCFSADQSYSDNIICSMKSAGTRTTLAGDAGSPFEVLWKDRYYLLGIYSWGERAAMLGDRDYFTKISEYVPWLRNFSEASDAEPF